MSEPIRRLRRAYQQVAATKGSPTARDIGLLVARIVLAWVFVYHGAGTLFGAFHGAGVHRASIFYGTVAHLRPATFFAVLGGVIELFGGAAVALGVFGRLAGVALAGDMVMAMITVTFANGISSDRPGGGYELNLALAGLACVVAALGTGEVSLDALLRRRTGRSGASPATQRIGTPPGRTPAVGHRADRTEGLGGAAIPWIRGRGGPVV